MQKIILFHKFGEKPLLHNKILKAEGFEITNISDKSFFFDMIRKEHEAIVFLHAVDISILMQIKQHMPFTRVCLAVDSKEIETLWFYREDVLAPCIKKPYSTKALIFFLKQEEKKLGREIYFPIYAHLSHLCTSYQKMPYNVLAMLQETLEWIAAYVKADSGSIMLLDPDDKTLQVVSSVGIAEQKLSNTKIALGNGIAGWVALRKESLLLSDDIIKKMLFSNFSPRKKIRGSLNMLLTTGDKVIGVLNLNSLSERFFSKTDFEIVSRYTKNLSALIEKTQEAELMSREYGKLETERKEVEHFIHSSFHDLKTPLFTLQGFLENFREHTGHTLDEKSIKYLARISHSARRLDRMINDVFEFFKYRTMVCAKEVINSEELVSIALDELQIIIEQEAVRIKIPQKKWPVIEGDKHQLIRVWVNLIENAIKYRHPRRKPIIEISFEKNTNQEMISFRIKDNGIGIDAQFSDYIFDVFSRLRDKAHIEGTGMGLAIVKKIVAHHGGDARVSSQKGKGSTFYFTLPKHSC